jgi:hypothetical protein
MLNIHYCLNSPACISEVVDDDLIVINLTSGRYYNMRHEAVACWQALTQGITPADLISANTWTEAQTSCFKTQIQFLLDEKLLVPSTEVAKASRGPRIEIGDADEPFRIDVFTDMQEMLRLDPIHEANVDVGWPHKA